MKKISLAILFMTSTFISETALAEIYVGLNAGGAMVNIEKNLSYNQKSADIFSSYMGLRAQLVAGFNIYGFDRGILYQPLDEQNRCQKLFFALEFDANYNSGDVTSSVTPWFLTTNASVTEKQNFGFDFFILGKYRAAPKVVWFFGPGMSSGNFEVSSGQTGGNLGFSGNNSSRLTGWSLKAGVEMPLTNALNIVVTYQYTQFNSLTLTAAEPLTGQNVITKYSPKINAITLGINFNNWAHLIKGNYEEPEAVRVPVQKIIVIKKEECIDEYCTEQPVVNVKHPPKKTKRVVQEKASSRGLSAGSRLIIRPAAKMPSKKQMIYAEAFPSRHFDDGVFSAPQEDPIPVVRGYDS